MAKMCPHLMRSIKPSFLEAQQTTSRITQRKLTKVHHNQILKKKTVIKIKNLKSSQRKRHIKYKTA